jgi:nitroimidazol reductase NimA-like FMN-containing flavoprotein (pyridoxamine 5'-phosphate oxidase superfamily)
MGATRSELPLWEAFELLDSKTFGRLGVIDGGYPMVFPMNYRIVHGDTVHDDTVHDDTVHGSGRTTIVFRAAPHTAVARYEGLATLEVDEIDPDGRNAWSVIVRGTLRRVLGACDLPDTFPLLTQGRHQWLTLDVTAVSGRRFVSAPLPDEFSVDWQPVAH